MTTENSAKIIIIIIIIIIIVWIDCCILKTGEYY